MKDPLEVQFGQRFRVLSPTFSAHNFAVESLWCHWMDTSFLESCSLPVSGLNSFLTWLHELVFSFHFDTKQLNCCEINTYDSIFCLASGAAGGRTSCKVHHKMIFSWPQHISGVLYRHSNFSSLNFIQSKRGNAVFPCSTYLVPVDWRPLVRVCLRIHWNETMRPWGR